MIKKYSDKTERALEKSVKNPKRILYDEINLKINRWLRISEITLKSLIRIKFKQNSN